MARKSKTIDRAYAFSLSLEAAIQADDLAMAQVIHALHLAPLHVQSLQLALTHGSLVLVQWVIEHRPDRLCCTAGVAHLCRACVDVAARTIGPTDPFGIATWLLEKGLLSVSDVNATAGLSAPAAAALLQSAALVRSCDARIVQYLLERGYVPSNLDRFVDKVLYASCYCEHEALVVTVLKSAVWEPLRDDFVYERTRPGGAKVLQWSRAYGADRKRWGRFDLDLVLFVASLRGHHDTIKWCVQARGVTRVMTWTGGASEYESLALIQWLHQSFCGQWLNATMDTAAYLGYLTVIQWLHIHRCEGSTTSAMDGAASQGHLHVVQWLHANRSEGSTKDAMSNAAANGHLHMVQWLHEHRIEGNICEAMAHAAVNGQLRVVQWCADHGACVR